MKSDATQSQSREQKIHRIAVELSKDRLMRQNMVFSPEEWAGILAELDDQAIDDFMYLYKERDEGLMDIEKKKDRKHATNAARYLQRLEMLRLRAESLRDNQSQ